MSTDELSGVRKIEYSTAIVKPGQASAPPEFQPYAGPFKLPPGRYEIRCRATDVAGKASQAMTGQWITGSDENFIQVEVVKEPMVD